MNLKNRWTDLEAPASFSSASYLAKSMRKNEKKVKQKLEKSIIFQAHRDLREKFSRRSDFATFEGERWELDTANFGNQLKPECY